MSFYTDKDLRNNKPIIKSKQIKTKPNDLLNNSTNKVKIQINTNTNNNNYNNTINKVADNIVDQARIEREQRQLNRIQIIKCIKIQKVFRGYLSRLKQFKAIRNLLDKQLNDISQLSVVLLKTKGINYYAPIQITTELTRNIIFISKSNSQDCKRFIKFCEFVLIPSLIQLDRQKNIINVLVHPSNYRMIRRIQRLTFNYLQININDSNNNSNVLINCLSLLLGKDRVNDISDYLPTDLLKHSVNQLDRHLNTFLSNFVSNNLTTDFIICLVVLLVDRVIESIKELLLHSSRSLIQLSISTHPFCYKSSNSQVDSLVDICIHLSTIKPDMLIYFSSKMLIDVNDNYISSYLVMNLLVLTTPCISTLMSSPIKQLLVESNMFKFLLTNQSIYLSNDLVNFLSNELANYPNVSMGQWLVGNIGELGRHIDKRLPNYLSICHDLQSIYPLIDIYLSMQRSIRWKTTGSVMLATSIPDMLISQLYNYISKDFTIYLANKAIDISDSLISTYLDSYIDRYIDRSIVEDSLKSWTSTIGLAESQLKVDIEKSIYFTSAWRNKLFNSLKRSVGITNESTVSNEITNSKIDRKADRKVVNELDGKIDRLLVIQLGSYWGLLLPICASSSLSTYPSQSLLSTINSCRNWIDRLNLMLMNLLGSSGFTRLESLVCVYPIDRHYIHVNSEDDGIIGLFLSIIASLKIALLYTDDMDLYTHHSPISLHLLVPLIKCMKILSYRIITSHPNIGKQEKTTDKSEINVHTSTASSIKLADSSVSSYFTDTFNSIFGTKNSKSDKNLDSNIDSNISAATTITVDNVIEQTRLYGTFKCLTSVLSDLYTRWIRKPFTKSYQLWELDSNSSITISHKIDLQDQVFIKILMDLPFIVPFKERMSLFRAFIDNEKDSIQGRLGYNSDNRSKGTIVTIRRRYVLEDGIKAFKEVDRKGARALKDRIVVRYINDNNEEEKGIDLGGLFKDFLTDLSSKVFDPKLGLFLSINSSTDVVSMYPNPASEMLYGEDTYSLYFFLGQVLGKALYENITLQTCFTHFFLSFMRAKYNYTHLIDDLKTFDEELYKNLLFLKSYEGDISDLSLTFSVNDDSFGCNKEIELIPNGSNISVSSSNRFRYIHAVAKYYLHDRIKTQAQSFFSGLYQIIQPDMLSIFCSSELHILISGSSDDIDLSDWKTNTRLVGYLPIDRHVSNFWSIVKDFNEADKRLLLRFVTSCERPPSLGFSSMNPSFTIQRVDCSDDSRLPTASTCFNVLKLPTYSNKQILKEKLLFSIRSNSGFDLS